MNLDEAIQHCEEVAEENHKMVESLINIDTDEQERCRECAKEHEQLAEWLKELKAYKEQGGDAISRKYILDLIATKGANLDDDLLIVEQWIQDAPSVNPHPIECGDAISRQMDPIEFGANLFAKAKEMQIKTVRACDVIVKIDEELSIMPEPFKVDFMCLVTRAVDKCENMNNKEVKENG